MKRSCLPLVSADMCHWKQFYDSYITNAVSSKSSMLSVRANMCKDTNIQRWHCRGVPCGRGYTYLLHIDVLRIFLYDIQYPSNIRRYSNCCKLFQASGVPAGTNELTFRRLAFPVVYAERVILLAGARLHHVIFDTNYGCMPLFLLGQLHWVWTRQGFAVVLPHNLKKQLGG